MNKRFHLILFVVIFIGVLSFYIMAQAQQATPSLSDKVQQIEKELKEIKESYSLKFWQNAFTTFIGAVLGFIFSIALFYFTRKWDKGRLRKSLEKNIIKEIEFNENFLQETLKWLTKVKEKITVNDRNIFATLNYGKYQRIFIQAYFREGFLYEKLNIEEIKNIDEVLAHMDIGSTDFINEMIIKWQSNNIAQKDFLVSISFECEYMEKYMAIIRDIKQKIMS